MRPLRSATLTAIPGAVEGFLRQRYALLVVGTLILVGVAQVAEGGLRLRHWDWLLVSGVVLYFALLPLALRESDRLTSTIARLRSRQALSPPSAVATCEVRLQVAAERFAVWCGGLGCALMLGGWLAAYRSAVPSHGVEVVVEVVATFPVGLFIGRAVIYGRLGHYFQACDVDVTVAPGHLDGVGGLKPVGDLFLLHATLIGAIAGYLGVWWLITPVYFPRYLVWRQPYLDFMAVMIAVELLAFLWPMWWFHRVMVAKKRALTKTADEVSHKVTRLTDAIVDADPQRRHELIEELTQRERQYRDIDALPTWPVDLRTRRRFAVRNVVLLVPIAANALSNQTSWQDLVSQLSKVVG